MTTRFLLAALAYIVPTFPLGYLWHLVFFKSYYASLLVYRPDMAFSLGVTSMAIQSVIWAYLYNRLFSGDRCCAAPSNSRRWPSRSPGAFWCCRSAPST